MSDAIVHFFVYSVVIGRSVAINLLFFLSSSIDFSHSFISFLSLPFLDLHSICSVSTFLSIKLKMIISYFRLTNVLIINSVSYFFDYTDTFKDSYVPTIEDTYRQVICCNKNICTLQITDTTGSHQFPAMQRLNISKGHAFMLVYSVTLRQSLDELIPIYKLIKEVKDGHDVPMILVGNKCDEEEARKIKKETGQKYVDELFKECSFIETSAKTNTNVQEAFQVNK